MALSAKLPWDLANPRWASELNPFLALPILNGNLVSSIALIANKPQAINHLLGRMPQGWFLTDNVTDTAVWRARDFSQYTITLQSSQDTTISFWIF